MREALMMLVDLGGLRELLRRSATACLSMERAEGFACPRRRAKEDDHD